MSLQGTDLALVSARIGVARIGAFRLGFAPDDVEGPGTVGPGEYGWQEVKPEDDGQDWDLMTPWSMCAPPPVASFTDAPDPASAGQTVQFTDTSTPTGEITFWRWTFGDGAESDAQNPTHAYAHNGTYTVRLWISSPRGSSSAVGTVTIVSTVVQGTIFDDSALAYPGAAVELCDTLNVIQETTITDAAGFYRFVDPTVTWGDGEAFKIWARSTGPGQSDTDSGGHLWASATTQVIDITMDGGGV